MHFEKTGGKNAYAHAISSQVSRNYFCCMIDVYTHARTTLLHDIRILAGEYEIGGGNCSRCADECFADNGDGFCTGESGQALFAIS